MKPDYEVWQKMSNEQRKEYKYKFGKKKKYSFIPLIYSAIFINGIYVLSALVLVNLVHLEYYALAKQIANQMYLLALSMTILVVFYCLFLIPFITKKHFLTPKKWLKQRGLI